VERINMKPPIKAIVALIIALLGTGTLIQLIPFFSSGTPIYPIEDAYVYEGAPTQNYGSSTQLRIGLEAPNYRYRSYLKFDLSAYKGQTITCTLNLYCAGGFGSSQGYGPMWSGSVLLVDDTWTEQTLTWNNQPNSLRVKSIDLTDRWTYTGEGWVSVSGWEQLNITDWVQDQFAKGDYIISIGVRGDEMTLSVMWFSSKETTTKCYIDVTTQAAPPTPTYTLSLTVKDQLGHLLPATVTVDQETKTCDQTGKVSFKVTQNKLATVTAKVNVGTRTYQTTTTIFMDKDKTETITITRRFYLLFDIKYSDGTKPDGILTMQNGELVSVGINQGKGEAYVLDGTYTVTFTASPPVTLGKLTVTDDLTYTATIDKTTNTVVGAPTTTPVTTPVVQPTPIPWVLLPSVYIYILTGGLFTLIVAAIFATRRMPKKWK
jgi:hypothetical protein